MVSFIKSHPLPFLGLLLAGALFLLLQPQKEGNFTQLDTLTRIDRAWKKARLVNTRQTRPDLASPGGVEDVTFQADRNENYELKFRNQDKLILVWQQNQERREWQEEKDCYLVSQIKVLKQPKALFSPESNSKFEVHEEGDETRLRWIHTVIAKGRPPVRFQQEVVYDPESYLPLSFASQNLDGKVARTSIKISYPKSLIEQSTPEPFCKGAKQPGNQVQFKVNPL